VLSAGFKSTPEGVEKTITFGGLLTKGGRSRVTGAGRFSCPVTCSCSGLLLPLSLNPVLFLKNLPVVRDVAGDYVGQGTDGEQVVTGDSRTGPGLGR
jgi:hypothetical protein